jgi:HPt (histidine-containing phosphotransfer) domain-containing protein
MTPPTERGGQQVPGESRPDGQRPEVSMMHAIAARAWQSNLARLAQLDDALQRAAAGTLALDGSAAAAQVAHQLVGSAGTFGYPRVSELGRRVELWFAAGALDDPGAAESAALDLATMRQDLVAGAADAGQ